MTRTPDPEQALVHAVGLCILNWWRVEAYIDDVFRAAFPESTPTDPSLDQTGLETKLETLDAAVRERGFSEAIVQRWERLRKPIGDKFKGMNAIARVSIEAARMNSRTPPHVLVRNVPMAALLRRHGKLHLLEIDAYANSFARLADEILTLCMEMQSHERPLAAPPS